MRKSSLVNIVYEDSLDRSFQSFQNQSDQVMSERSLLLNLIHRHIDCVSDRWIDVDYKGLVVIAQKDCTSIGSRHYAFYGDLGRVVIHLVIIILVAFFFRDFGIRGIFQGESPRIHGCRRLADGSCSNAGRDLLAFQAVG